MESRPKRGRTPSIRSAGRPCPVGGVLPEYFPSKVAARPSTAPVGRSLKPAPITIATQTPTAMAPRRVATETESLASRRCSHESCSLYAAVDGFCARHAPAKSPSNYSSKLMESGRPRTAAAAAGTGGDGGRRGAAPTACRAPKCGRDAVCNGYCALHHGSPVDEDLLCRAAGCSFYRDAGGDGFCAAHRPGRPMPASPNKAAIKRAAQRGGLPAAAPAAADRSAADARAVRFAAADADGAFASAAAEAEAAAADGRGSGRQRYAALCRTPGGATVRVDVRPADLASRLYDRVADAVGLDVGDLRLVFAGRPLEPRRRIGDYGMPRNATVAVALAKGGSTPCGPCLHQWVRAIQVNGADVRVGGSDSRWPDADAFERVNRALVGADGRARVVLTFEAPETAKNASLGWGRVEPARGGTAVDVDVAAVAACFGLARAEARDRRVDDGAPRAALLDPRPGDAAASRRGGPTDGELAHRARTGFSFRYDFFEASRQVTLQFANVEPDVEYLLGLATLGAGGAVVHDAAPAKAPDWGDGFRDPCSWRVVFARARRFVADEPPDSPKPVAVPVPARPACCAVS